MGARKVQADFSESVRVANSELFPPQFFSPWTGATYVGEEDDSQEFAYCGNSHSFFVTNLVRVVNHV